MWTCDEDGGPVKDSIRVDGTDACTCDSCKRRALVQRAIGTCDAGASGLADAARYFNEWDDPAQGQRIVSLYQQTFARLSDELRQVVGARPLTIKH